VAGPGPEVTHELIGAKDIADLKSRILASGLSISQLVSTAWASAATFRGNRQARRAPTARAFASRHRRSGRSTIQPNWRKCCGRSRESRRRSNDSPGGGKKKVSLADLIVLGGCAAVEQAAKKAG